jgi:uncharacterized membrane protein
MQLCRYKCFLAVHAWQSIITLDNNVIVQSNIGFTQEKKWVFKHVAGIVSFYRII